MRGRLLAALLSLIILLEIVLLLSNTYGALSGSDPNAASFLASDFVALLILFGLWLLNRIGFSTVAGALLVAFLAAVPGFVFRP
ncbi:MAG: hypothetical protein AB1531_01650, partial [Chloroflexota bacterium]